MHWIQVDLHSFDQNILSLENWFQDTKPQEETWLEVVIFRYFSFPSYIQFKLWQECNP